MSLTISLFYRLAELITKDEDQRDVCGFCRSTEKRGLRTYRVRPVFLGTSSPLRLASPATLKVRLCQGCAKQLTDIGPHVRDALIFTEPVVIDTVRRWLQYNADLEFYPFGHDVFFELQLFQLLKDSRASFLLGQYIAAIMLISAAVELALKTDTRIDIPGRRNLNMKTLAEGLRVGSPVQLLLEPHEFAEGTMKGPEPVKFINRRNEAAHGVISSALSKQISNQQDAEVEAADQLRKGQAFLIAWGTTPGNPHVSSSLAPAIMNPDGRSERSITFGAGGTALELRMVNPFDQSRWR